MKSALRRILAVLLLSFTTHNGAVELIANPNVSEENLSRSFVRSIFTMRMTSWPSGMPIRVFVLGDKDKLHARFSKRMLGVFPHQLRRAWNRQIFSGIGQAPEKVKSESEMRAKVSRTPGAIGYLSEDMINEQIRTIAVE
jgi:ABC-type phosphate transport system substrate-binding protein